MPRITIERFQEGDLVSKGNEHGKVVTCTNRQTGEQFVMVWIQDGPRKNTREYPRHGWIVELDWSPDGPRAICSDCEREFRRPTVEEDGVRQIFCRQCQRQLDATNDARAANAGSLGETIRGRDWRRSHNPAAETLPGDGEGRR